MKPFFYFIIIYFLFFHMHYKKAIHPLCQINWSQAN